MLGFEEGMKVDFNMRRMGLGLVRGWRIGWEGFADGIFSWNVEKI